MSTMFVVCRLFMSRSHGEVAARDLPFVSVDAMLPRNAMFVGFFSLSPSVCVMREIRARHADNNNNNNRQRTCTRIASPFAAYTHRDDFNVANIAHMCGYYASRLLSRSRFCCSALCPTTTPNSLKCGYRIIRCVCFFSFSVNEHGASECKRNVNEMKKKTRASATLVFISLYVLSASTRLDCLSMCVAFVVLHACFEFCARISGT